MNSSEFFWLEKLSKNNIVLAAARHNKREFKDASSIPDNIDTNRSSLNEILVGARTANEVAARAKALMKQAGINRPKRRDAVLCIEALFSLPIDSTINSTDYFRDCVAWVADNFGGELNILSADIHRDEGAPHCHVLILPLHDGRMIGSDMVGNSTRLKALWTDFSEVVALKHGLKRRARLRSDVKRAGAMDVLSELRRRDDRVLGSVVWEQFRKCVQADPEPFMSALGIEPVMLRKPARTCAQIMTSSGKGPKTEINAIGFRSRAHQQFEGNDENGEEKGPNLGFCPSGIDDLPAIVGQNPIGDSVTNHTSV